MYVKNDTRMCSAVSVMRLEGSVKKNSTCEESVREMTAQLVVV